MKTTEVKIGDKEWWKWILSNVSTGSIYDREHGISVIGSYPAYEDNNIIFNIRNKSDGQKQLDILFRIGLNSQYWWRWSPIDEQAIRLINMFPILYGEVKKHNRRLWRGTPGSIGKSSPSG